MSRFTIGVDFGTNSARAVVVSIADGHEVAAAVYPYRGGRQGIILDPHDANLARQDAREYVAALEQAIPEAIGLAREADPTFAPERVIAIGVDATGSTPIPVDAANQPLTADPRWRDNPAAHAWLWKDHTSAAEARRITALAAQHRPAYLAKIGGTYSSEWFWSKILHCLETAPDVFTAATSWVECADWIPSVLAGVSDPAAVRRGVCAAGHKGLYCDEWGGLPDKEFLAMLHPRLADLRDRLFAKAFAADVTAGILSLDWAARLGLRDGIPIAIGGIDAHYGAVGAGVAPGTLVKIMGTSTCDCTVSAPGADLPDIPGICGIVKGSILPGHYGLEAGQSAVGDIFRWFIECVCRGDATLHARLTGEARNAPPGAHGLLALDWNNGNRNVLVDPELTGLLVGQTLHTTAAEIYRALIEATAFGARTIIARLRESGVAVDRIVCCGGLAGRNDLLMQVYADVTGCDMEVAGSEQTCALGAAISAAVAAGMSRGGYATFAEAQFHMVPPTRARFRPDPAARAVYDELYALYLRLHDSFGGVDRAADLGGVMKELIALRRRARGA